MIACHYLYRYHHQLFCDLMWAHRFIMMTHKPSESTKESFWFLNKTFPVQICPWYQLGLLKCMLDLNETTQHHRTKNLKVHEDYKEYTWFLLKTLLHTFCVQTKNYQGSSAAAASVERLKNPPSQHDTWPGIFPQTRQQQSPPDWTRQVLQTQWRIYDRNSLSESDPCI